MDRAFTFIPTLIHVHIYQDVHVHTCPTKVLLVEIADTNSHTSTHPDAHSI